MKKEKIKIERYVIGNEGHEMYVYAIPHEMKGFTNFYVQKKGGLQIIFIEGIKTDELNITIEELINRNLCDWFGDFANYVTINESIYTLIQDALDRIE